MNKKNYLGNVHKQVLGFRIRQLVKEERGEKITKFYITAGKRLVQNKEGYDSFKEASDVLDKIASGEIKANIFGKHEKKKNR